MGDKGEEERTMILPLFRIVASDQPTVLYVIPVHSGS